MAGRSKMSAHALPFSFLCFHLQPFRVIKGLAIVRLPG